MTNQRNNSWIPLINPIVTILVCVFFQIIYSPWGQVQTVSTIDNSHETKQLMAMEKDIRDLRNENEQLNTDISNTRTDLEEKLRQQKKVQESSKEVSKILHEMDDKIKKIERETSSTSEILKKAEEARTVLQNENRERIKQVNTNISNTRTDLEEKLRQQEKIVNKTIQETNKVVSEMNDKIKKTEENCSSLSETIKKAEELKRELKKVEEKVAVLNDNAFNKSVLLNLVVFLTIAVFALIIGMLIIWNRVSFDHHGNTPRHGSGTHSRMSVIERVPNNPPLTNTICVISYGQTNESFNHTLVHKLMRQLSQPLHDTPVRGHLINTHADIANIPHCKLIFMCVEYSTRHVIIEEPDIGQGDIRRTTYDAIRKLGATLVILYTRDHDSRQLRDGLRYQSNIYCVASQSELKVLDDKNCFYSVFDSFTPFQVEQVKDVIRNALQ